MNIQSVFSGFVKSVLAGQARTATAATGGALTALGVANQVNAASLDGAIYYLFNASLVIVPAVFSYLQKKSVVSLVQAAVVASPGTPEAAAVIAKVS